ncbi:MAG: magnesium and cobalt transport protein CorA [Methylotenera sp. 17-45-7]|jgi:magnesium transporter|nr:MAG: magnesium and cobalt transport protein CorA [Mehylophilales bacterium 35-46-6]OZA09236.1 MAG: magnesium and cobalt transport protein CorA [Methylotenera sp. 17-45-7]HQS44153.1 magnesium/cobalt transporter CorA [Methylotenera sp.]
MKKAHPRRRKPNRTKKTGLPPGSLVYVGQGDDDISKLAEPKLTLISYDSEVFEETTITSDALASLHADASKKLWLNVHGIHDTSLIKQIGQIFSLHPLVLEDILNTEQRPKVDEYGDYLFMETRYFYYEKESLSVSSEQISIVLGRNFILTFQERSTGAFAPVRERLRPQHSPMRALGVDYLAYSLLDSIVDKYFHVLEQMDDDSEALEDALLANPSIAQLHSIHQLKRASIELRRVVWPLREVINHLARNEHGFFSATTIPYLRDIYDHTVSFIESLESIRDSLSGLMDIYMTGVSNRVNLEVRALTVVAMLFMPATLIAGIFGMNFNYMPWIHERHGFWWAMSVMAAIAILMLMIFWRRQWLSSKT